MYRQAVKMANREHKKTGRRYFVMPNTDTRIFLIVTDRKNFRQIRQKGYIDPNMKLEDVFNRCFYYTAQKDGAGKNITEDELKIKQIAYQMWYEERLGKMPHDRKVRAEASRKARRNLREMKRKYRAKLNEIEQKEGERYEQIRRKYKK